jgi:hypothetical protein
MELHMNIDDDADANNCISGKSVLSSSVKAYGAVTTCAVFTHLFLVVLLVKLLVILKV